MLENIDRPWAEPKLKHAETGTTRPRMLAAWLRATGPELEPQPGLVRQRIGRLWCQLELFARETKEAYDR